MASRKGSPNKDTVDAQMLSKALGIDPFEILLHFAAGNWNRLGYKAATVTVHTSEDSSYEKDVISPELRVGAAKEAANYLLPKRKSLDFDIKELPDQAFDQEIERRVHLKILKGEIKASDVG